VVAGPSFGTIQWSNAITKNGSASFSSPCVSSTGHVFFGAEDGFLYALDAVTGVEVWEQDTTGGAVSISSPTLYEAMDMVFLASGSSTSAVRAFNMSNGEELWEYEGYGDNLRSRVAIDQASNQLFVSFGNAKNVRSLSIFDGSLNWISNIKAFVSSSPSLANGLVFVVATNGLYGLNMTTGIQRYFFAAAGNTYSAPFTEGSLVYFGTTDKFVYCVTTDTTTSTTHVEYAPATTAFTNNISSITHQPSSASTLHPSTLHPSRQPSLAMTTSPSNRARLSRQPTCNPTIATTKSGSPSTSKPSSKPKTSNAPSASPSLAPSIDSKQQQQPTNSKGVKVMQLVWKVARTSGGVASAVVDRRAVYIGSNDGTLYAINKTQGTISWTYKTSRHQAFSATAQIGPHRLIYIGTLEGDFVAIGDNSDLKYSTPKDNSDKSKDELLTSVDIAMIILIPLLFLCACSSWYGRKYRQHQAMKEQNALATAYERRMSNAESGTEKGFEQQFSMQQQVPMQQQV